MEKLGTEVAAPSDLQPSTINWADLAAKAIELPDAQEPVAVAPSESSLPTIAEVAAKAAETIVEGPKATETTSAPNPEREVRKFQDDDLVEVKVDGEVKVVPYKEYKDGVQREAVFTQRMQTLARQREAAEQELAQQYANLYQQAQVLEAQRKQFEENNPLAKLAKQLEAQEKTEQDPNTLATIGEIQKALSSHRTELQQEFARREAEQQARLAQAAQQIQTQQIVAADAARFTAALNETLSQKDLAVVKSVVPNPEIAEAIIRYNVAQMDPRSIEEGIEFMHNFVKQWADNVKGQQKVEDGRAAAQKARAVIESPSGSPPSPQQTPKPQNFFKKDGGLDWGALHQRALATLEG